MPVGVVWSKLARDELLDIYVKIGLENPAAAERVYDRIDQLVRHLSRQPRMGPRRPDIRQRARVLIEAPYWILYELHPDTDNGPVDIVEIVNVVDSRRDLTSGR